MWARLPIENNGHEVKVSLYLYICFMLHLAACIYSIPFLLLLFSAMEKLLCCAMVQNNIIIKLY